MLVYELPLTAWGAGLWRLLQAEFACSLKSGVLFWGWGIREFFCLLPARNNRNEPDTGWTKSFPERAHVRLLPTPLKALSSLNAGFIVKSFPSSVPAE